MTDRRPGGTQSTDAPLLEVTDLSTTFASDRGHVRAVRGVSFTLQRGQDPRHRRRVGLAASPCCPARSWAWCPSNAHRTGSVRFEGKEVLNAKPKVMRNIWGDQMAMVFQDPMTALNPVMRIGNQITESLNEHIDLTKADADETALALLRSVGIPEPAAAAEAVPPRAVGRHAPARR